jgi:hypothetical protein
MNSTPSDDPATLDESSTGDTDHRPAGPPVNGLFAIDATGPDDVFEGWHDPDNDWNGFATPSFDRTNATKVIAWVTQAEGDWADPTTTFRWDDDVLLMTETHSPGEKYVTRIEPDDHGRYPIGAYSWTWNEIHIPEREQLGPWLRRIHEQNIVHAHANNLTIDRGTQTGLNHPALSIASRAAGERAVEHLRSLRPDDPQAPLPQETVKQLGLDGPRRARERSQPLTWAMLSDGERIKVMDLAVARATPPTLLRSAAHPRSAIWTIDGTDLDVLLEELRHPSGVSTLRVVIDQGLRVQVNHWHWSRPLGHAE